MTQISRKTLLEDVETYVVKVGSRVLSGPQGVLDKSQVGRLAEQLIHLADQGKQVVLVSSGAVASGVGKLKLPERPADLSVLQAVAAVGQAHLIQTYEQYFSLHDRHAAQILLIADDLDDRARYLNVRNTLFALLEMQVIPVINENDSVAVDELQPTFGDNDRLAAMVAGLFEKPALVILSDVDGVYDRDPSLPNAKIMPLIHDVDDDILAMAIHKQSSVSKGGMASKLRAAHFVMRSGAPVIIAGGRTENVLPRLLAGEELGTAFVPHHMRLVPRKRWIGFTAQAAGALIVDAGAERAILARGPSLLAIGVVSVNGRFNRGEVISIRNVADVELARGLSNYSSGELLQIKGLHSDQIGDALGHCPYIEVVHRDNMTITMVE